MTPAAYTKISASTSRRWTAPGIGAVRGTASWNLMVVGRLMRQRHIKMTYPMLDHLRILNEVLAGGFLAFGLGALIVCFKLLVVVAVPVNVPRSA